MVALHLNTVLPVIAWEQFEPEEGVDETGRGHYWRFYDYGSNTDGGLTIPDSSTGISRCSVCRYE